MKKKENIATAEDIDNQNPEERGKLFPVVQTGDKSLVPYDPLQMYLWEIKNYQLLTREEEKELAIRVREHKDEKAAYRLITSATLPFVVKHFWPLIT